MKGIAACSIKQIDAFWSIKKLFAYKMMINFRRTKPYVEVSLPGEGSRKEREWEDMDYSKERIFPMHASPFTKAKAEDRTQAERLLWSPDQCFITGW